MDPILFFGGCIFIVLAFLSYFDRDRLWRIYSLEKGWRRRNPERTPEWDVRTKQMAVIYLIFGLAAWVISVSAGGG